MTPAGAPVIVVGVDGSEHSVRALRWAIDEARLRGATVRAVQAWQYPNVAVTGFPVEAATMEGIGAAVQDHLDRVVGGERAEGVDIECRALVGSAAHVLLDATRDALLLVVGSRGRGGFAGLLLGSVSLQVSHHAPCPVVVVRGD